ncbi:MAG: hypothetical protein ACK5NB_08075 [Flavobacteriaceae bacterium]
MNGFEQLTSKINQAKDLDFGDIINETIELFKQVWLKGFLVILLIMVAAMVIGGLFALTGLVDNANYFILYKQLETEELGWFFLKNTLFGIPQTILISTITIALTAAFYRICNAVVTKKNVDDNYFYFFNKPYLSKVFMLGIIYTGIATLAQLLLLIPYIYAFIPLSFFAVILANNPNLSETEIVKASFALGNKKWGISFGAMFVAGIMAALGVIGCGIGLLFTLSIAYLPLYVIYKNAIGIDNTDEIDDIGTSEESNY